MAPSELYKSIEDLKKEFLWLKVAKYFEKVDSTQKRILQFLPKEDDGAVLIIAENQTQSVGRLDRPWASPPGGVWFTLALPMKNLPVAQAASFSMVSALTIAESLQEVNNLSCEIKWPNDIRYEQKKLGGILLTTTAKFKKNWLLIGVGINVNNEIPSDLAKIATSIRQIRGQTQGRTRLIESVLLGLWTAWQEFDRTGFGPYHKAYEEKMVGVGSSTKISAGSKTFSGTMVGVDTQGGLVLKSGQKLQTVQAGEIVG